MNNQEFNEQIKNWWNKNSFTYGLSKKQGSYRDVGNVADEELNKEFFDNYMRKVRKNSDAQKKGERMASRFIDYNYTQGKKVLDIAVGYGWSAFEFADSGAILTAIDITPRAVEVTKKHLEIRGLSAEVLVMDAQDLKFKNNTFDYVHAWGCLMHMPDTQQAVNEIFRVLKPGGKTVGYLYNKNSVTFWWHRWFLRGILCGQLLKFKGNIQKLVSRFGDGESIGGCPLIKVYTPKQAKKMFEQTGFINVRVVPWGPPELLDNFPLRKLPLGRLFPYKIKKKISDKYGWGMIFYADKPTT